METGDSKQTTLGKALCMNENTPGMDIPRDS